MSKTFLTLTQAKQTVRMWQSILGLSDWKIDIEIVRASVFGDHETLGTIEGGRTKCKAVIQLLDERDYRGSAGDSSIWIDDHETVIVHELLHLIMPPRFIGKSRTDERYLQYERAIDKLARGFIALKRA